MKIRRELTEEEINGILGRHKKSLEEYIAPYLKPYTEPITKNVYVVYKCDEIYDDLMERGARGRCDYDDGYIYLRSDREPTAHLLIHEFIHRVSRNRKFVIKPFGTQWVEGIDFPQKDLFDLNESITEMIAIDITGERECGHPYNEGVDILEKLCKPNDKNDMIEDYFTGNLSFFKKKLKKNYKNFLFCFKDMMRCWLSYNSPERKPNDMDDFSIAKSNLENMISWLS